MIRGTTPTFQLKLKDETVDLTQTNNVYVTFSQQNVKINKDGEDLDVFPHQVDVYLTQEESLKFKADANIDIQLNWTYDDGSRACTNIISIYVGKNLIGKVLE